MPKHRSMNTALDLLVNATDTTDRALLTWTAGALTIPHCLNLAVYRANRKPNTLGTEYAGGAGKGVAYTVTRRGVTIRPYQYGGELFVGWGEVAALLAPVIDRPELVAHQNALLRRRVALTGTSDRDAWRDIEAACYEAADVVWDKCYPVTQLDLFALGDNCTAHFDSASERTVETVKVRKR